MSIEWIRNGWFVCSISKRKRSDKSIFHFNEVQLEILRRYYYTLYPPKLQENERVCLFIVPTDKNGVPLKDKDEKERKYNHYVSSFEEYINYIESHRNTCHIYNALATVKAKKITEDGKKPKDTRVKSDMKRQQVLFIDFDRKDYPDLKDVREFSDMIKKKVPVFLHSYYDSGHGFHFYIRINPTCKISEISAFNKELCALVGADTRACLETQVARVPCTLNRKYPNEDGKFPVVMEIHHYMKSARQRELFKPVHLDNLKRNVYGAKKFNEAIPEKTFEEWKYYEENGLFEIKQYPCLCTEKVFREGVVETERNIWLGRIIVWLTKQKYPRSVIEEKCQEWNTRCRPPKTIQETKDEIDYWYKWFEDHRKDGGMGLIGGCYWHIKEERIRAIVEKHCGTDEKYHCKQALDPYASLSITKDRGVFLPDKLLTDKKLSAKGNYTMSGYEYLILTILDEYMPKTKRKMPYTIKNLKYRMQWKKGGKWHLCMDISTFKKTLEDLEKHKCIKISEPTQSKCKQKNPTFDDNVIKLARGLKDIEEKDCIRFFYAAARALISHQITQNEYKVYLCILRNLKQNKNCTLETMDVILNMGERNILRSIQNLEIAGLLKVDRLISYDKKIKYNLYHPIDTEEFDSDTDIDKEGYIGQFRITLTA